MTLEGQLPTIDVVLPHFNCIPNQHDYIFHVGVYSIVKMVAVCICQLWPAIQGIRAHFLTFFASILPTSSTKIAENHNAAILFLLSVSFKSWLGGGSCESSSIGTTRRRHRQQMTCRMQLTHFWGNRKKNATSVEHNFLTTNWVAFLETKSTSQPTRRSLRTGTSFSDTDSLSTAH
jgi:hypothetical protein